MDTVLRHADPVSILMTVMAAGLLLACGGLVILAAIGVRRVLTPVRLEAAARAGHPGSVSYTHLTLPTILRV